MTKEKSKIGRIFKKVLKIIAIVILTILLVLAIGIAIFAYINLNADDIDMKKVWRAGYTEKQVEIADGVIINYAESSDPSGEKTSLLLIHGQGMAWEDYARVLPKLAKEYHVYAVDCHGHGSSSRNPERYNCAIMTNDYIRFIEEVMQTPCVISGHSSGGIIGANIATVSPENVLGLVIEDSPFFSVRPEEMENTFVWKDGFVITYDFIRQTEEKYYVPYYFENGYFWSLFKGLGKIPAKTARKYSEKYQKECKEIWYMPYLWMHGLRFIDECDTDFPETFYDGSWFDNVSQEEILKGIQCPCIYIKAKTSYGEDGVLLAANTDEDADKVIGFIKNCKKVTMTTSDHDVHFVHDKEFIQVMYDFKKSLQE